MRSRSSRALAPVLALTAALGLTACGQPLTIATWLNVEPGSELSLRVFRTDITGPLEGGIFAIIELDLSDPLHITGTIDVPQVRLGSPGLTCIRKDTSSTVRGSIEIDVLTGEQNVDFPLAVIASGSLFPGDISGVGSPPPGSIQFPLDLALLDPVLNTGSLEGALSLPVTVDQVFQVNTVKVPAKVNMTLLSSNDPPIVSADVATECGASWALQGSELDYAMNARGTYLHTVSDNRRAPQVIDLATLGVVPGDNLRLRRKGSYSDNVLPDNRRIAGVFSATNNLREDPIGGLLWWFNPSRLPDAINAGVDVKTPPTFWLLVPTNIKEDFEVLDSTVVTVPAGAKYLYFTPIDNHFDENFSFDLRVGVDRLP